MMYRLLIIFFSFLAMPLFAQQKASIPQSSQGTYDSIRIVLEDMYDLDQGIRKKFVEAMQAGSASTGELIAQMNEADSLNQIQIQEILEKYGWLENSQVGQKAASAIFYVVQHADVDVMERYYPSLKALADRGEANPLHAAMMLDRILMYQNKKQVYGTQSSNLVREEKISVIWPVQEPEKVNTLRKEVGFKQSIEEYAASMDAIYDPNEKLPAKNVWK